MSKRRRTDPVAAAIKLTLRMGQFISYRGSWSFMDGLREAKNSIDVLRLTAELEQTGQASALPERPAARPALNDLLLRVGGRRQRKANGH